MYVYHDWRQAQTVIAMEEPTEASRARRRVLFMRGICMLTHRSLSNATLQVFAICSNKALCVYSVETGKRLRCLKKCHDKKPNRLVVLPPSSSGVGQQLATGDEEGQVADSFVHDSFTTPISRFALGTSTPTTRSLANTRSKKTSSTTSRCTGNTCWRPVQMERLPRTTSEIDR